MLEFDKKISLGGVLVGLAQIAVVCAALATGFLTSRDKVHDLELEVANQKLAMALEMTNQKLATATLGGRFDVFETTMTGALARLQNLLTDLRVDAATRGLGARK